MRALAWVFGLSLFACGRVDTEPNAAATGQGGSARADGGAANAMPASGARAVGLGGGGSAGMIGDAGTPASAGTGGTASAGTSGTAIGEGGATTGAAGSSVVVGSAGTYDACGCGCCGVPVNNRCYYPELGEDLTEIIAQDRAAAGSAECATIGCAAGTHYVPCETPAVEEGSKYSVAGYSDNKQHLVISRESQTGRCTRVVFPVKLPHPGVVFELPTPVPGPERTDDGVCGELEPESPSGRPPIGALGSLKQPDQSGCVFDFDYTLFFLAADGLADAMRFKSEGVRMLGCTQ